MVRPPMPDKQTATHATRASADLGDMIRRGRTPPSRVGLNPAVTKAAVDLQNLTAASLDATVAAALESLREVSGCDSICIAQLGEDGVTIEKISHATSMLAGCGPEGLVGQSLDGLPWIRRRLKHMRLLEITDTGNPGARGVAEGELFRGFGIGAALIEGISADDVPLGFLAVFSASPVDSWNVEFYLLMKLIGSSLASGLGRLRTQAVLHEIREREELYTAAANDGIWDFDVDNNTLTFSPRWKEMMGYGPDELNDRSVDWHHMVHPDDMVRVQGRIREHLEGRTPIFESVHRMRHKCGDWRWVMSRAKARIDEGRAQAAAPGGAGDR